jgi:hypothetical protein
MGDPAAAADGAANPKTARIEYAAIANTSSKKIKASYRNKAGQPLAMGDEQSDAVATFVEKAILAQIDTPEAKTKVQGAKKSGMRFMWDSKGDNLSVIQVTSGDYKAEWSLKFQDVIREDFQAGGHSTAGDCTSFSTKLREKVVFYTENPPINEKFAAVQEQLEEAKQTTLDTIEAELQRQDLIKLVEEEADDLALSSVDFHKHAKTLKDNLWWKNAKFWICIVVLALVLIACIIGFVCLSAKC